MAKTRSLKRPAAVGQKTSPAGFDKQFALNVTLPLAEAAYDLALGKPPLLPRGYSLIAPIAIDTGKMNLMMKRASLPQQRLLRAVVDEGHIGGLVARNDQAKTLAVSFRGTRTPQEWLKDFDFLATPYIPLKNWGKVHEGLQLVYLAMRVSVTGLVAASIGTSTEIVIVGHSLGAAVSILCAPDLAKNVTSIMPTLHTYAGPRVGQGAFDDRFDATIPGCFRIVNRWDIVPHLPPPLAAYRHVGQEVQVDGGFTLDLATAHSLERSYRPGLERLTTRTALIGVAA